MPIPESAVLSRADMTDAGLLSPRFDDLGVRLHDGGGTLRVWSAHASSIDLLIFDNDDLDWVIETVPLARTDGDIWSAYAAGLRPGTHYAIQVDGPQGPGNTFNPSTLLIDPYARGLASNGFRGWRSVVVAGDFDWCGARKPLVPLGLKQDAPA